MKLIIDIDDNSYELINKTSITLNFDTVFHGKEKDKEMTFAIFDLVKALKNGTHYEERPQGEWEWIDYAGEASYHCSICRYVVGRCAMNFCPNCGADMKGGKENNHGKK